MPADTDNSLATFVSSLAGGDGLRVEEMLGQGYVRLRVSEAERRQAKHDIRSVEDAVIELLRNARDADARRIFVATSRVGDARSVTVIDDGRGIPDSMRERVFDARVTSKLDTMHMDRWGVHGRGMALFSIRENATSARVVDSVVGGGCSVGVQFDVSGISERADQSTWPTVRADGGDYAVRGPRNIVRACVEFGLETERACAVYVGSPSEMVATMRARLAREIPYGTQAAPLSEQPVVWRAALARDARELREAAASLGIEMSERTAHRIVRGEIEPLRNVRAMVLGPAARSAEPAGFAARKLALSAEDRAELASVLAGDFARVAERYYMRLVAEPRIRTTEGRMTVTFEYDEDE